MEEEIGVVHRKKPGGNSHYGWLWGIWAYDSLTAWVCSDRSGLVAKTTDGGNTWIVFRPGEQIGDTFLSFRDISPYPGFPDPTKIVLAASNGKIVYTTNNGNTWLWLSPFNTDKQWFSGLFNGLVEDFFFFCGSGGTIGRRVENPEPLWYSRKYDLNDIGGYVLLSANYLVAVGTNSAIIWSKQITGISERLYISDINASSGNTISLTWRVYNPLPCSQPARCRVWYSFLHEEDYATSPRFYRQYPDVYTAIVPPSSHVEF